MTKFRGVSLRGLRRMADSLADIPGAFLHLIPGEQMGFRRGTDILSIASVLSGQQIVMNDSGTGAYWQVQYLSGRAYLYNGKTTPTLLDNTDKARWKFLHVGESYSVFLVFNPKPIPVGTGTQNVRYLLGTKNTTSTNPGLAIRLANDPAKANFIRVSRQSGTNLESSANAYLDNRDNLLELRVTKPAASSTRFELWVNRVLVGSATSTAADNTADSQGWFDLSNTVSTSRFMGYMGEVFIVKNTGKADAQVLAESTVINTYFNKYLQTL